MPAIAAVPLGRLVEAQAALALELADGGQRLIVNCGGPGLLPTDLPEDLVKGLRTTAAHSTLVLSDTNSTNILADGSLGQGGEDQQRDVPQVGEGHVGALHAGRRQSVGADQSDCAHQIGLIR